MKALIIVESLIAWKNKGCSSWCNNALIKPDYLILRKQQIRICDCAIETRETPNSQNTSWSYVFRTFAEIARCAWIFCITWQHITMLAAAKFHGSLFPQHLVPTYSKIYVVCLSKAMLVLSFTWWLYPLTYSVHYWRIDTEKQAHALNYIQKNQKKIEKYVVPLQVKTNDHKKNTQRTLWL